MIVAPTDDEAKKLRRCLESVAPHVDEVCITITGKNELVEKVAKTFNAKISYFEWVDDFAKARTYSFEQATGDWILWLDADDVLRGANKLRQYVDIADQHNVDGFVFKYHYGHDEHGNLIETHWKCQMVKNDGHAEWKGAIHEDILPKRAANWTKIQDVIRVHTATKEENDGHYERNRAILERETKENPKEPRNWFYLGRTLLGMGEYERVIECLSKYLELSGWDQERYEARMMIGEAYMKLGNNRTALMAFNDATLEYEGAPDAYIYKARVYVGQEDWEQALTNLEIAGALKGRGVIVENPTLYQRDLPALAALCLIRLNRPDEALKLAQNAAKFSKDKHVAELLTLAKDLATQKVLADTYVKLGNWLFKNDMKEQLSTLVDSVPDSIADDPQILELRFAAKEPKKWPKKSVAVFCGPSVESWDGNSINNGGIGGSETAVIELSKRFVKKGYDVVVYSRCDAPAKGAEIDGVKYMNYWTIDKRDEFDVLILWRNIGAADYAWNARKLILDLHDVSFINEFTEDRINRLDHIFVKSQYHKSLYPMIPDEKFVVVGNGIDLSRFEGDETRNKNRFVYTSAPNRGLEALLQMWPKIKQEIPEAQLHVYYGWQTFYESEKHNPERRQWIDKLRQMLEQDGIVNHGRVDQKTLAKHLQQSSLWLYPTDFPEIHCITALEMQAAGVYPITTGFAALAETQKTGVKLPGDPYDETWQAKYTEEVVDAYMELATGGLEDQIKEGLEFVKSNQWGNVADIWMETIKP